MLEHYALAYARDGRTRLLEELRDSLEQEVVESLSGLAHIDRLYFRVKDREKFAKKATDPDTAPPYSNPLVEIEDQVAGRVLVFFLEDIHVVRTRLEGTFATIEQEHKRPIRDREFGYESHHLICVIPPHLRPDGWDDRDDLPPTFELQTRTIFMHAYAEPQHDIDYKGHKDLPWHIGKQLAWIAASSWGADQAYQRVWAWHTSLQDQES